MKPYLSTSNPYPCQYITLRIIHQREFLENYKNLDSIEDR